MGFRTDLALRQNSFARIEPLATMRLDQGRPGLELPFYISLSVIQLSPFIGRGKEDYERQAFHFDDECTVQHLTRHCVAIHAPSFTNDI